MADSLVIIPTFNERDNIASIVDRALAASERLDVLIVDDNSPDGTGRIADRLRDASARVHLLHRTEKTGLGAAYLDGFRWGLAAGYERLVEMDADGSHHPEDLPRLLDLLDGSDVVLGSRWVPGGAVENWPLRRKLLSRGGNLYTRLALGIAVRDATGGFRDPLGAASSSGRGARGTCAPSTPALRARWIPPHSASLTGSNCWLAFRSAGSWPNLGQVVPVRTTRL